LGLTVEAIASPTSDDNEVELEFEANFHFLTESLTSGWVTSHFDVVDQFSPAERPGADRAYTHKLDFELDTAFHVFNFLPEGRWLRGLELETSWTILRRAFQNAATWPRTARDFWTTPATGPCRSCSSFRLRRSRRRPARGREGRRSIPGRIVERQPPQQRENRFGRDHTIHDMS
jgi:hypothetical protein